MPRERKKAKMEASHDSASGNEPSGSEPSASGSASGSEPSSEQLSEFVSCDVFDYLWKCVTASIYPICLLGAKGVGKSTILRQLHNKLQDETEKRSLYADFSNSFLDVDNLCVELWTLAEQAKEGKTMQWVFIDNIQEATKHEKARSLVKLYVKQPAHNKGLAIVAAVSADGLRLLMDDKDIRLHNCDFTVINVNPDKNVAEKLLKVCRCFNNYEEKLREVMDSFGWVPGEAVQLAKHLDLRFIVETPKEDELNSSLRIFEIKRQAFFSNCLKRYLDITRSCGKAHCERMFALCLLNGVKTTHMDCVAKEELPWTFLQLMTQKRKHLSDVETIMAVSEQAKTAIRDVLQSNQDIQKTVFEMMKAMAMRGEGSVRGCYFEEAVFNKLIMPGTKFKYIPSDKPTGHEVEIKSTLNIEIVMERRYCKSNFKANTNTGYLCPFMEDVDIILNNEGVVYFIQCSIQKFGTLANNKKGFWKSAKKEWIPVLMTPYTIQEELKGSKCELAKEYRLGKFNIAAANFLGDEILRLLQQ